MLFVSSLPFPSLSSKRSLETLSCEEKRGDGFANPLNPHSRPILLFTSWKKSLKITPRIEHVGRGASRYHQDFVGACYEPTS